MILHGFIVIYVAWFLVLFFFASPLSFCMVWYNPTFCIYDHSETTYMNAHLKGPSHIIHVS